MKIYRILGNGVLTHQTMMGQVVRFQMQEPVVSVETDVLDTNNPERMTEYRKNLDMLIQKAKEEKGVYDFRIIREDDLFPYDWEWRVNSPETYREYARSNFAYYLRMEEAKRRAPHDDRFAQLPFEVPFNEDKIQEEASKLDPFFGKVYEPVRFRSTKHFTINTPLAYTGEYNQVDSDRIFTIIDTVDAFCDSGYGYSADYRDAYLDVTHEELPISQDAIVLISENDYSQVMKDPVIQEQLKDRRVVVYRGNKAVAINMVLASEGVLPYRFSGRFHDYDPDLEQIMSQSMRRFCAQNNLDYAHNHGNLFGKGGHFTDTLDSDNNDRSGFEKEFCSFMKEQLPEYAGLLSDTFYQYSYRTIPAIGFQKVVNALGAYNEWAAEDEKEKRANYDREREHVTPEMHELFVKTIQLIRQFFAEGKPVTPELSDAIHKFYHGDLRTQVSGAEKLQSLLLEDAMQY